MIIGISIVNVQPYATAYQKGLDKGGELMEKAAFEAAKQIIEESKTDKP
jgi:hypothetical protein